jgi:hypothetical protein
MSDQAEVPLHRQCGAMEAHHRMLESDPSFRKNQEDLEGQVSRRMSMRLADMGELRVTPYVINVVVHVVHNVPEQNISMSQIKTQIAVLNRDFRALNPDKSKVPPVWKGLTTNANIIFQLATKDPQGQPTNGVTRTKTNNALGFGADDSVKSNATGGKSPWNPAKYLNLWVCKMTGGLLGYAQFPGGPVLTDGVVINYKALGTNGTASAPFNLGRTATHEVGHFLNLRHIWGDTPDCSGSDLVDDTPNAQGPNFGKPVFPKVTCNNAPNGDMFMNYMDYVDDDAMVMFTAQQVERMHTTLDGVRASLVS